MAYITADQTRAIKKRLQAKFPEFKFSVRNLHFSKVSVTIVSGPVDFGLSKEGRTYRQINGYYPENYENSDILEEIMTIINDGNHDNSDIMTDYFDVGWYWDINVGDWDKTYVLTGPTKVAA